MNPIHDWLRELDAHWTLEEHEPVTLRVIGSVALFLQTNYRRGTKDGDIIETAELDSDTKQRLLLIAGRDSDLFRKHRLYLDIVGRSVPMLSSSAEWVPHSMELRSLRLEVLSVVDVVISKLWRFHGDDRDDIRAMVEGEHAAHAVLKRRFQDLIFDYQFDARARRLITMADRLNEVERDWYVVQDTDYDLPDHIFEQ